MATYASIRYQSDSTGTTVYSTTADHRITKGLARYTSNFTAPTAALKG